MAAFLFPFIKEWWAKVINAPEDNNSIVFNNGIAKGSSAVIPYGGQVLPISMLGYKLEWK